MAIVLIYGNPGCLAGSSLINVNRAGRGGKYRIDHIYRMLHNDAAYKDKLWNLSIPTNVRSFDGHSIRLHTMKDVIKSGMRQVFRLELENGRSITATPDHEIRTLKGWISLDKCLGEQVMCDTLRPKRGKQRSFKMVDGSVRVPFHPFKNHHLTVPPHILTFEASLNNMHFIEFLDILWNDKKSAALLKFMNPSTHVVHHVNGNHFDNSVNNLVMLSHDEHNKLHGNNKNFHQGIPEYSKAISIVDAGEMMTYDIICDEPYHNFVSDGIVVHNSGKTASAVREMMTDRKHHRIFTNIIPKRPKDCPHITVINKEMIIRKEVVGEKKTKDGFVPVYKMTLNKEFWMNLNEPIDVILDEAHTLLNARRAMSKQTEILLEWLALIRRVLGQGQAGSGDLILISQLSRRLDVVAREMGGQARFHICHYTKTCQKCGLHWKENNEMPEPIMTCPYCGSSSIKRHDFGIEVYRFASTDAFSAWKDFGMKTFYSHFMITDIEKYFPCYDTLQWDNLFS